MDPMEKTQTAPDPPYPGERRYLVQGETEGIWHPVYTFEPIQTALNRYEVRKATEPHKEWRIIEETRTYRVMEMPWDTTS